MALLHEEKLLPEAIAEGNNDRIVIKPLVTQVYKHIPSAQSLAEYFNFFQKGFLSLKFGLSVTNILIMTEVLLHCGHLLCKTVS